ncbi:MAG: hypothetical protein KatS3mg011_1233 [Acidimicrobiia bacterium]|nr:MAG: hypothetical protein KatS3mg011_1233 [Acidimicrobiia bacterium]
MPGPGSPQPLVGSGEAAIAYRVVTETDFPVVLTPGSEGTLVATKDGKVYRLEGDRLVEVLDISSRVENEHEQGFLGMAVDPLHPDRLYVHYSKAVTGDTVVSRFRIDPDGIDPRSEEVVFTWEQPGQVHNGGMIQFGPHGLLYIGLGDGGGIGDPFGNGQNVETPLGGILRIDPHGGEPYAIPADNPFLGEGSPELWVYGLRNPWRFWIDYPTETMYIGDVGQALSEEIDVVGLDEGGVNFGWSIMEGNHCYGTETEPAPDCDRRGLRAPAVEIVRRGQNACAVVGGVVYRGDAIPELQGHYLYSDFCGGWLRSFRWADGAVVDERDWTPQVGAAGQVVSFGVDRAGEVYLLTTDRILQIVPAD